MKFAAVFGLTLAACGPVYLQNPPQCADGTAWNGQACAPLQAAAANSTASTAAESAPAPDPGTCPPASHWSGSKCVGDMAPSCPPGMRFVPDRGCLEDRHDKRRHPADATLVGERYWVSPSVTRDERTGLTWSRAISERRVDHRGAMAFCASLAADGGGWRLPSKDELVGIVEAGRKPTIAKDAFPGTPSEEFWTSTSEAGSIMATVDFGSGRAESSPSAFDKRARCVKTTP